ncbi:hypothetical protein BJV74DRAFT_901588 [Russula compacta]|nr:hypothetical protein BJV74DRAFT_901588 [Russula compacta]
MPPARLRCSAVRYGLLYQALANALHLLFTQRLRSSSILRQLQCTVSLHRRALPYGDMFLGQKQSDNGLAMAATAGQYWQLSNKHLDKVEKLVQVSNGKAFFEGSRMNFGSMEHGQVFARGPHVYCTGLRAYLLFSWRNGRQRYSCFVTRVGVIEKVAGACRWFDRVATMLTLVLSAAGQATHCSATSEGGPERAFDKSMIWQLWKDVMEPTLIGTGKLVASPKLKSPRYGTSAAARSCRPHNRTRGLLYARPGRATKMSSPIITTRARFSAVRDGGSRPDIVEERCVMGVLGTGVERRLSPGIDDARRLDVSMEASWSWMERESGQSPSREFLAARLCKNPKSAAIRHMWLNEHIRQSAMSATYAATLPSQQLARSQTETVGLSPLPQIQPCNRFVP